jgi:hypothetical protein
VESVVEQLVQVLPDMVWVEPAVAVTAGAVAKCRDFVVDGDGELPDAAVNERVTAGGVRGCPGGRF